jgi:hypothetical protein
MAPAPTGGTIMAIMGGGAATGGGGGCSFVSPIGSATTRELPLLRLDCCNRRKRNRNYKPKMLHPFPGSFLLLITRICELKKMQVISSDSRGGESSKKKPMAGAALKVRHLFFLIKHSEKGGKQEIGNIF